MNFLSTVADLIVLNLLFLICCIPVVTIGAAYSAKYYVAMKIIKGEGTGVIVPYFKSFARNFKQSTIVWIIMLFAFALIILDWRWIIYNGWSNTSWVYKVAIIAFTLVVWLMTLAIFPTISRYEMKTGELFKAALIFVVIKFIPLVLISVFIIGSIVACIWYAQWFPLLYVFCSTTLTYFMSLIFIKQFDKLEKAQADKLQALAEEKARLEAEKNDDPLPDLPIEDATGNMSIASAKIKNKELEKNLDTPDEVEEDTSGNKFTRYIRGEKKKLAGLTRKQKLGNFVQYYLPGTILVLLVIGAISWYGYDLYRNKMRVVSGGLINCSASKEGVEYATDGFLQWGGYAKQRTASLQDSDLSFKNQLEYEEKYLEVAFRASLLTGNFDYLIMREDAAYNYSTPDYFMDMNALVNMENFSEDDFYYFVPDENEKDSSGVSLMDLFGSGDEEEEDAPIPIALKLTDEIEGKLGLDQQYDYYIAFAYSDRSDGDENHTRFIEYLFGKC